MRRVLTAALLIVVPVLAAWPAGAHEEISPATIPTGRPVFLLLSAANESKADLVRITLGAPAGTPFGATTREPQGWTADVSETSITWTGGAVKPDRFEQWGFEIEGADQPGALSYKASLGFADGTTTSAEVVVNATSPDAGAVPPPSAAATTSSTAVTATNPGPGTAESAPTRDRTARGRANLAVALGAVAVLVALGAAFARPRRRSPASAVGAAPAAGGQDW